ncbi:putative unusual protein kinase [Synechococcus sp. PCC 7502]|uniref:ABC1 kinase family protein n=1 Tax=Synechococcus sp. PCC 7502 TaxID=1173263 RepID=UPI00029FB8E3|nr:AarF/ABC1/UbiB kinase family protein [Synechococcus sp. PCC 7502]AFY75195.1 putative unusual protein kinase [Synechococcus sp. PCC 7502]
MLTTAQPNSKKLLRWQKVKHTSFSRQRDIFGAAFTFIFFLWWDGRSPSSEIKLKRAKWLVRKMLDLGPTFIKVGQSLSTRIDLFPPEYVQAFSELQDKVPAFDSRDAIAILEIELGKSLYSVYRDFSLEPIAAASLGQVHRGVLHTGEEVVIKVQRPKLRELFDLDRVVCAQLLKVLRRYFKWMKQYDLEGIFAEFFTILYQEIDYRQEGKNADRFRANFANNPEVVVPRVYWEYSSAKVLTLEFVPGIKVNDLPALAANNIDPKAITEIGIRCYLKQFLQDGFFHADPHPGNLAVTSGGSLVFYDYGMMSEVVTIDREQMVKSFLAILRKDANSLVDTLTAMGLIEKVGDMTAIKRMMKFVLERFTDKPVDIKEFGEIKSELYIIFEKQPFRLPPKMTYLLKSLSTLAGVALILDPEYNFKSAAQPFIKSLIVNQGGGMLGAIARQTQEFISAKINQPRGTEIVLRRLEERLDQGELRVQVTSIETDRALKQIKLGVKSLIYACIGGFMLLSGTILLLGNFANWAIVTFAIAAWNFIYLWRTLGQLSFREKLDEFVEK